MKFFKVLAIYFSITLSNVIFAALPSYTLNEYIGKDWDTHIVQYDLTEKDINELNKGYVLVNHLGKETPFQIDTIEKKIYFIASMAPFSTNTYSFKKGKSSLESKMYVKEGEDIIEAGNGYFAIRIRKSLADNEGPLEGWLLQSGHWVGNSAIESEETITSYKADVIQQGPVQTLIKFDILFSNGGAYSQIYKIHAVDPLVMLKEQCNAVDGTGAFKIIFSKNYRADFLLHRLGSLPFQITEKFIDPTSVETLFTLEPWLHWNFNKAQGIGFDLVATASDDSQFFLAANPAIWVDPSIPRNERVSSDLKLKQNKTNIYIEADIKKGEREYILGSSSISAVIEDIKGENSGDEIDRIEDEVVSMQKTLLGGIDEKLLVRWLPSQQFQIKYSDFPLDNVKDFVLDWPEKHQSYPRFILTEEQTARFRELSDPTEKELKRAIYLSSNPNFDPEAVIPIYIATQDEQLAASIIKSTLSALQNNVTRLTDGSIVCVGVAPHNYISRISKHLIVLDTVYPALNDEQKRLLRAQVAFLGYLVNSPAYWDSDRGFGAMFVNMHTTVHKTQANIASMINDHPMSEEWMDNAMDFLVDKLLNTWSDSDGNWTGINVEAPHYAMGSFDDLLAILLIARNTGMNNLIDTKGMKQMGEFFAKISTPPDSRIKGWRHLPPIGNTYKFEPTGIFAILASVYEKSDPTFAAQMQWMQYQQGNPQNSVVGGYLAGFAGYRSILKELTVEPMVPQYKSEHLKDAGVILRSSFNTPDEAMLYLIAGKGATPRRHYDMDQGAVTIWGKGEIISDDFGYNGRAPEEEQSMISSPSAGGIMEVAQFTTDANMDYVKGVKQNWIRQALLIKKGALKNNPEYFVIHDSFIKPADAIWRIWLSAQPEEIAGASMLTTGFINKNSVDEISFDLKEEKDAIIEVKDFTANTKSITPSLLLGPKNAILNGVEKNNTDIIFAQLPVNSKIETEIKTKTPYGVNSEGRYGRTSTSQIGIILKSKSFKSLLTLIFPRGKNDEAPKVTTIADNRGFKIEHSRGTDYVFASDQPIKWTGDDITFSGTVGLVQQGKSSTVISLSDKGSLSFKDLSIQSTGEAVSKELVR